MPETTPPSEVLWGLVNFHVVSRCIHVVAEAGVADALDERPASATQLASATGLNADALGRILRLLSSHGVFASGPDGYAHTDVSRLLRSDHPQSLRAFARMIGSPISWNGLADLQHPARTGSPAKDSAALFAYLAEHPEEGRLFNQAMAGKSAAVVPAVVEAYDFSRFQTIADIGGGRGHLIQAILARVPNASGVLFDLPYVVKDAAGAASSRLRLVGGDFFRDPLPAADAYVIMEVIHDWDDEKSAAILSAVHRAAPKHATLLIVEALVSEAPGAHFSKLLDILMLAITGGRERTPSEYQRLLATSGFQLTSVIPTRSQYSIVEATVA